MQLRGKEIIVHRGETFTLDMSIKNRDGTPFIIDKELSNCYLLFSISSSKYTQSNRYLKNWWLDLANVPKFNSTIPVKIAEFTYNNLAADDEGYAYVYVSTEDGVTKYKYWDGAKFVDYDFRIKKTFLNTDTDNWSEKSYVYSLSFVSGSDSKDYLTKKWDASWGTMPESFESAWRLATTKNPDILKTLPDSRPIYNYSTVLVFIEPSKLTVLSDIRGAL